VFGYDSTSEWTNAVFSYGSADNLYFETNSIRYSSSFVSSNADAGWTETGQGGRLVIRFNTYDFSNVTNDLEYWDIHGFQNWNGTVNSGQTGTMLEEIYGNTITNGHGNRLINHRGSWGMYFDNTFTGSGNPKIHIDQYAAGEVNGSGCSADINPAPVG